MTLKAPSMAMPMMIQKAIGLCSSGKLTFMENVLTTKVGTHLMRLARSYDVPVVMDDKKATWPIAKRIQDMLSMLERTNFND